MSRNRIMGLAGQMARDTGGATLVELAIVLPVLLLIILGLLDFGRLGYEYVWAQKATQMAARIAVVRPAACPGVPEFYTGGGAGASYGTNCRSAAGVCANPGTVSCDGVATNATAAEIWAGVAPLLPNDASIANLRFTYTFNSDFGFLGGPYEPMVTVELQNLQFQFVSPLGALAALAGAANSSLGKAMSFPSMSVSLPGEDLAQGEDG